MVNDRDEAITITKDQAIKLIEESPDNTRFMVYRSDYMGFDHVHWAIYFDYIGEPHSDIYKSPWLPKE